MRQVMAVCFALFLVGGIAGCDKKAEVKTETTETSPEGTTTTTDTHSVETDKN